MSRFDRLVGLRRLREEAAALRFSESVARLREADNRLQRLAEETEQVRQEAVTAVRENDRLPVNRYEDFYRGQRVREFHLQRDRQESVKGMELARQVWQEARTQLRQVEKLAEKDDARLFEEQKRNQLKAIDEAGTVRYQFRDMEYEG
ncbi:MAG: flagellar export protein FliJ [Magnetococcales bacterium]|nr:flagellar export protein FliJ [Magnetococcales bacterium]